MNEKSKFEIERWTKILADERYIALKAQEPKARLRAYIASKILGREFSEDLDAYLVRRGLVEFFAWAKEVLT